LRYISELYADPSGSNLVTASKTDNAAKLNDAGGVGITPEQSPDS